MAETKEIRPQPKQEIFLSSPADIAIYGGGAGGGKTWALLLEQLRHKDNKEFGSVIFRKSYPQITSEGGLWDKSLSMFPHVGATPKIGDLLWTFPSGAKVKFAHLQYDTNVLDWQGSEIPLICFDELTHFSDYQFFYMLSRNRSMCGVRPYVRATCNPDADSWVAKFISWWIDEEAGYPIYSRGGVIRYFVRINNVLHSADSPDELIAQFGEDAQPKSVTFVPALLSDNEELLRADPGYRANLKALPLVEQERLLGGNWKIRPEAGKVFNREWFEIVDSVPAGSVECRGWDFAATEQKLKGDDPDYTASVKMRRVGNVFYIIDCTEERKSPADIDGYVQKFSDNDRLFADSRCPYLVRWEIEPGSSGKTESYRRVVNLVGYDAKGKIASGDKLSRASALAAQALVGNVKLLRGAWNERFLTHMHHQPDYAHDDIMDASAIAFNAIIEYEELQKRSASYSFQQYGYRP